MRKIRSFFQPTLELMRNRDAMLFNLPVILLLMAFIALLVVAGIVLTNNVVKDSQPAAREAQATIDASKAEAADAAGNVADALGQAAANAILTPAPTASGPNAAEVAATAAIEAARIATQQKAEADAAALALQQQALAFQQTQQAQEQEWKETEWAATSTAAAEGTATAYPMTATAAAWTQTAMPFYATADANQMINQQALSAMQVQHTAEQMARQRVTTPFLFALGALAVMIVAFAVWKMSQYVRLTPDGNLNMIEAGGVKHVVWADLMTAPVVTLAGRGLVQLNGAVAYQQNVVQDAAKVRAIRYAAYGTRQEPFDVAQQVMAPSTPFLINPPASDLETKEYLESKWQEQP